MIMKHACTPEEVSRIRFVCMQISPPTEAWQRGIYTAHNHFTRSLKDASFVNILPVTWEPNWNLGRFVLSACAIHVRYPIP